MSERNQEDYSNLTVVAISLPEKERNLELLRPNYSLLEKFKDKKLYFADCFLSCKDIIMAFGNSPYGHERCATYEYRTSGRKAYLNSLSNKLKETRKIFCIVDYSENVKRVLSIENNLVLNGETVKTEDKNHLKASIFNAQTFERANFTLCSLNLDYKCVLYADFSLAYSIHLMTNCEIIYDTHDDFNPNMNGLLSKKHSLITLANSEILKSDAWMKSSPYMGIIDGKPFKLYLCKKNNNGFYGVISNRVGLGFAKGEILDGNKMHFDWHYIVNGVPQNGFVDYPLIKNAFSISNERILIQG